MEIATLLKRVLLIGIIGVGLLIFWFWWAFYRTQSTNISKQTQYAEVVGKELTAKHESFIALNYKHYVKENPYLLQMYDRFDEDSGEIYQLPIGTKFRIEDAKSFYNAVSGTSSNYLLGSVYVEELGKEVQFEIPWGYSGISALSDKEPFDLFGLVPWLSEPLPYKYYYDGRKEPHVWPPRITDYDFNIASKHRFVLSDTLKKNRSFDTTYEKDEDWGPDKNYFGVHSVLEEKYIGILKLDEVYPDYKSNPDKYTFHPDYSMELSRNFITLVVTLFIGEHELESRLINYDLDGNIIDHLKISYDEIAEGTTKRESFLKGRTIRVNDIISLDKDTVTTSTYGIQDTGKIEVITK